MLPLPKPLMTVDCGFCLPRGIMSTCWTHCRYASELRCSSLDSVQPTMFGLSILNHRMNYWTRCRACRKVHRHGPRCGSLVLAGGYVTSTPYSAVQRRLVNPWLGYSVYILVCLKWGGADMLRLCCIIIIIMFIYWKQWQTALWQQVKQWMKS